MINSIIYIRIENLSFYFFCVNDFEIKGPFWTSFELWRNEGVDIFL